MHLKSVIRRLILVSLKGIPVIISLNIMNDLSPYRKTKSAYNVTD